jgi:uncharacterized membrane protein YdbT with pleckstrin-like domain
MDAHNPGEIRSSLSILIIKLISAVLLINLAYIAVSYALTVQFDIPSEWNHHISVGLVLFQLLKAIVEVVLVVYITLDWYNRAYEFVGQNLIIRHGSLRVTEDIHELKHLRLASIKQSFPGKIFHFGNIELLSSMPGGSQGTISLYGVANPDQFEPLIKACITGASL